MKSPVTEFSVPSKITHSFVQGGLLPGGDSRKDVWADLEKPCLHTDTQRGSFLKKEEGIIIFSPRQRVSWVGFVCVFVLAGRGRLGTL